MEKLFNDTARLPKLLLYLVEKLSRCGRFQHGLIIMIVSSLIFERPGILIGGNHSYSQFRRPNAKFI